MARLLPELKGSAYKSEASESYALGFPIKIEDKKGRSSIVSIDTTGATTLHNAIIKAGFLPFQASNSRFATLSYTVLPREKK